MCDLHDSSEGEAGADLVAGAHSAEGQISVADRVSECSAKKTCKVLFIKMIILNQCYFLAVTLFATTSNFIYIHQNQC